jgi:hypothetical protein
MTLTYEWSGIGHRTGQSPARCFRLCQARASGREGGSRGRWRVGKALGNWGTVPSS